MGGSLPGDRARDAQRTPIRDLLDRDVVSVSPELAIDVLEAVLIERQLAAVPVVDAEQRLLGLVASGDILRELHDRAGDAADDGYRGELGYPPLTVAEIMSPPPARIRDGATVAEAAAAMARAGVHRLPVLSDTGRLVGIASALDILRWLAAPPATRAAPTPAQPAPAAPSLCFAVDERGCFTMLGGGAALASLGLPEPDAPLLGRSIFEVWGDVVGVGAACRRALAGEAHTEWLAGPDRPYQLRLEPLRDASGQVSGAVGLVSEGAAPGSGHPDADESYLIEAAQAAALGSLAGGVAHQLNNALTYVRLCLGRLITLELSRRPLSPVRLHRLELLQDVREGIARVASVSAALSTFAHLDEPAAGPVDLARVLDDALRLIQHEVRHRARLTRRYQAVPLVRASEAGLHQVFLNLIINAAQMLPAGDAHLNHIEVAIRPDEPGRVVVEVSDTGPGIGPEVIGRIFEPFFTTHPSGRAIGLGLSICRDLVKQVGGDISVVSALGHGTTFRVVLPACDPAGEVASAAVAAAAAAAADRPAPVTNRRGRVLIVDDDRPVAAAVALELADHDVVVAGSGREAIEILTRDDRFDVVLCDLMMPEVTGMDVFDALADLDPELARRFVFMTGGAFTARAREFLRRVPNLRIDKPFAPEALRATLADLLPRPGGGAPTSRD